MPISDAWGGHPKVTYSIRTGDDGEWKGSYSKSEVTVAAMELAHSKNGNAQIRNNSTREIVGRIRESKWQRVSDEIKWY